MKTSIGLFAASLFAFGCGAPAGDAQGASPDPNAFLQPGGNSYSAAAGIVVAIDHVDMYLQGNVSTSGNCLIMAPTPEGSGDIYSSDEGTITADGLSPEQIGTWVSDGDTSDTICLFGECQTCTVSMSGDMCGIACKAPLPIPELYDSVESDLIPFAFTCDDVQCTTLGGAAVNSDGTITYGGVALGTWQGTHVEAQICFGHESCAFFHPTM
jgi:hypothetical protein